MPILSRFNGIIIRMYFQRAEHNPPHIHAEYAGEVAEISIRTGAVLDGHLPPKTLMLVRLWIEIHKTELMKMWETQEFRKIPPLNTKR